MTEQPAETVNEAVEVILCLLSPAEQKELRETDQEDLIFYHHSLGRAIRNQMGLWAGNTALLDACAEQSTVKEMMGDHLHPDEASMVLIVATWRTLREVRNAPLAAAEEKPNDVR